VVRAATELADRDGLTALTMRSLAQHLGIAPMSLYTYVPGRAELLDLMLDAAYAAMVRTTTDGRPWRHRVQAVADDNRALFVEHPWAALISTLRPPLGPGQLAKYEHELGALDGQAWWASAGPLLAQVLDVQAYPLAVRVGTAAGAAQQSALNPDHAYAFGLDRLLDAFAALVADAAPR
jgi:AcrR family transcriptional regulator